MTDRTDYQDGLAALEARDLERAAAAFARAVAADPADSEARTRLANAYRDLRRLDEAEREIRAVVAARPQDAKAHSALGVILTESGRPAEAVAAYEAAMAADSTYVTAASNWLNAQQYVPGATDESLARAHARWAQLHAPPTPSPAFSNPPIKQRPIVVGFVSPDLAQHPVGRLSVKLLENLRNSGLVPVVFSNRPAEAEDDLSRRIARHSRWSSVYSLSDTSLTAFIKQAKIDILVDMCGHTGHNRAKVFAGRAAPVQAAWLGYPSTTGIPAMDYMIATDALAPPGFDDHAVEKIVRLTGSHVCFEPPQDAPSVAPRPAEKNGFITFGCFNNPAKVSDDALAAFAGILARVPDSRIRFHYQTMSAPGLQARFRETLSRHGIAAERIAFAAESTRTDFLAGYGAVDIALDSFPYSGCMTTCEALWMGVPVVTFRGPLMAGRQSAGILEAAGVRELIAADRSGFEDLAVKLAQTKHQLILLRTGLRSRLATSPLCDTPLFTREFVGALREMWTAWCEKQPAQGG
ncbi:MAG: tetratricopeptide repeat protein [Rhodospirillaceae bacterium]